MPLIERSRTLPNGERATWTEETRPDGVTRYVSTSGHGLRGHEVRTVGSVRLEHLTRSARHARSHSTATLDRAVPPVVSRPPLAQPSVSRRANPNLDLERTARHEAAHAITAHLLGWRVERAVIYADGSGSCFAHAHAGLVGARRAAELVVLRYASRAALGWSPIDSYGDDDRQAWATLREFTVGLDPVRVRALNESLRTRARQLVDTPKFGLLARRVAEALLSRRQLDEIALARVIRDAEREYRGWPALNPSI